MRGSHPLIVIYHIHYKLMKTILEPQTLSTSLNIAHYYYNLAHQTIVYILLNKLIGIGLIS